jgi:hypothetical protein
MEFTANCAVLIDQVMYKLLSLTKYVSSLSLSECLALATAVTFVNIMVLGFGLDLCLSNRNMLFWLILHFMFLNVTVELDIIFLSGSSSKLFNNYLTTSVVHTHPIPLLPILYLIILTQSTVSTLSL